MAEDIQQAHLQPDKNNTGIDHMQKQFVQNCLQAALFGLSIHFARQAVLREH